MRVGDISNVWQDVVEVLVEPELPFSTLGIG